MDEEMKKLLKQGFTWAEIEKMLFMRRTQGEHVREEQQKEKHRQEFIKYLIKKGKLES